MSRMLTWDEIERRKDQAVRFVRDVLDDPDRADEIDDESLEDYAERKGFAIANPDDQGETTMSQYKTRDELAAENEELRNRLAAIGEMAEPDDDVPETDEVDDDDDEIDDDDDG